MGDWFLMTAETSLKSRNMNWQCQHLSHFNYTHGFAARYKLRSVESRVLVRLIVTEFVDLCTTTANKGCMPNFDWRICAHKGRFPAVRQSGSVCWHSLRVPRGDLRIGWQNLERWLHSRNRTCVEQSKKLISITIVNHNSALYSHNFKFENVQLLRT